MSRWSRPLIALLAAVVLAALVTPAAAQSGPTVRVIPVSGQMLLSALSPDGRTLAVFENPQVLDFVVDPLALPIRLIDLESGTTTLLGGHTDYATAAVFTSDGARLITAHGNGDLLVWDVASATIAQRILGFPGATPISLAADDRTLATRLAAVITQVTIWDLSSGQITHVLTPRLETYKEYQELFLARPVPESPAAMVLSPDGSTLWVASVYGRVWRWDVASSSSTLVVDNPSERPDFPIRALSITADGSALIYHDRTAGQTVILDTASGRVRETIAVTTQLPPAVTPDGRRIAWFDRDTLTFSVWDAAQGGAPQPLAVDFASIAVDQEALSIPPSGLPILYFTPDGQQLIFAGFLNADARDNAVLVIDLGA